MPAISFQNVVVSVPDMKQAKQYVPLTCQRNIPRKVVLHNVSGAFPSRGLVAIMGPSGSGKTTLLSVLSNRLGVGGGGHAKCSGIVRIDGSEVSPSFFHSKSVAFVPQDTCLFAELTPRESIRFATKCMLPKLTHEQTERKVAKTLADLNLTKCADTLIGNEIFRGVSGGERKRVSIGVSIVAEPSVLFLDEPTTGLDTETAGNVVRSIQGLSGKNKETNTNGPQIAGDKVVIMTLHQPSNEIWEMIDHLVLLVGGYIVYNGPANKCMDYIITIGFKRPIHITPADYFLDVIECVEEDEEEKEPSNNKSSNSANNRSSIMSNASASASSAVASVTSPVTKRGSERGSVVPLSSPNLSALVSSYGKAGSIMGTSIANAGGKNGPSQATIAANRKQRMLFLANRWKQYTKASLTTDTQGLSPRAKRTQLLEIMNKYKSKAAAKRRRSMSTAKTDQDNEDEEEDGVDEDDEDYDEYMGSGSTTPNPGGGSQRQRSRRYDMSVSHDWDGVALDAEKMTVWERFQFEVKLLASRSYIINKRTKLIIPMKIAQIFLTALLIIIMFAPLSSTQVSVLDRGGAMYINIICQMFATVLSVVMLFPQERGVFLHEQASRRYSVISYFVSKLLIDIPFILITIFLYSLFVYFPIGLQPHGFGGFLLVLCLVSFCGHGIGLTVACAVASPSVAALLAPLCIAPFILFSHMALPGDPSHTLSGGMRFFQSISPFWWGLDALFITEFRGLHLYCSQAETYTMPTASGMIPLCRFIRGEEVLDFYGINPSSYGTCVGNLFGLSIAYISLAGILLKVLSTRVSSSVPLLPPQVPRGKE